MNVKTKPAAEAPVAEDDARSAPDLRGPVRDKAKLGDTQYGVTPPREAVESPQVADGIVTCAACNAELAADHLYRADGEEYAYHFCDAGCHERWRVRQRQNPNDPRMPKA